MKKGFLRNCSIGYAIGAIAGIVIICAFVLGAKIGSDKEASAIELGMKISDLKWLARAGKISEEELDEFNDSASDADVSIKEMNQLLDELLEGKEDEYLKERHELIEKIQSLEN